MFISVPGSSPTFLGGLPFTAPVEITGPSISGAALQGSTLTVTPGTWVGNPPPVLTYQWLRNGQPIAGATGLTHVLVGADAGMLIACEEIATNARSSGVAITNSVGPIFGAPLNVTPPSIAGSTTEGSTLVVTPGVWTGYPAVTFTYQWLRAGTPIAGATGLTYVTVLADLGNNITCREAASNSQGSGSAISNAIGPISSAPVNTALPSIAGSTVQGSTLTVTPGTWTGFPTPVLTYQWLRGGSPIAGATALTYVTALADQGATITCQETATNGGGVVNAISNAIGPIVAAPVNVAAPTITGNARQGSTLSIVPGTWTGFPVPALTYQWRRSGANIVGATSQTYVTVTADQGATITCVETATNSQGVASQGTNAIGPIVAAPVNTVAPVISGSAIQGSTLTVTPGTWTGFPVPVLTYQWLSNGAAISGATGLTYVLQASDLATSITCQETAINSQGASSATSNAIGPIVGLGYGRGGYGRGGYGVPGY